MSNALALAGVTAVLKDLLNDGVIDHDLTGVVGPVTISTLPPDRVAVGEDEASQINLYLYHVSHNAAWRNAELPSRGGNGARLTNPPLALDLHYLLTAYGGSDFHAEVLLGYAMQILHETPVLTRDAIRKALAPAAPVGPGGILPQAYTARAAAEVAEQTEQLRITPDPLGTEEMSRLWTSFQAHYRTTVAYRVSVVLIRSRAATTPVLPVRERKVYVVPFRIPVLHAVEAASRATDPILPGSTIVLRGENLSGAGVRVRIGAMELTPSGGVATDTRIGIALPGGLRAGVQQAQVLQQQPMGDPPTPHRGFESNVAPFVLRPVIVTAGKGAVLPDDGLLIADLELELSPPVGRTQRLRVLMNELEAPTNREPRAYAFEAPPRSAPGEPEERPDLTVPVHGVEPGKYVVRVQVDGAESVYLPGAGPVPPQLVVELP